MVDTNQGSETGGTPLWRRRTFWLGGGALAGLATLGLMAPRAMAFRGLHGSFGHGHRGFGAQILKDPAAAKEHAAAAVEFALRSVNATDEQKQQARRITDRLVDELGPMAEAHRVNREAIAKEFTKPQIERAAIERLRQQELELADRASKLAVTGFADLADVLTAEQRQDLIAFAHRFHGGHTE
jgi:periplasmic protein CpxP/Spy